MRCFLRQVVTGALDDAMRAWSTELGGIRLAVGGRYYTIGIAIHRDAWNRDDGLRSQALFQFVVLRIAGRQ
ncbi:hypothetical protein D3C81_1633850 [compost metagenome]